MKKLLIIGERRQCLFSCLKGTNKPFNHILLLSILANFSIDQNAAIIFLLQISTLKWLWNIHCKLYFSNQIFVVNYKSFSLNVKKLELWLRNSLQNSDYWMCWRLEKFKLGLNNIERITSLRTSAKPEIFLPNWLNNLGVLPAWDDLSDWSEVFSSFRSIELIAFPWLISNADLRRST